MRHSASEQDTSRRTGRWALLIAATLTGICAVPLAAAQPALAISAPIQIANTGGEGVFIRSEPTKNSERLGWMAEGTSPEYHCFVWGEDINGVPIWFNVTHDGITGYYASYYDDSSYHSNAELTAKYGVPLCGEPAPASPTPASQAPPPTAPTNSPAPSGPATPSAPASTPNAFYNRSAAVDWALSNAKDAQSRTAMCAWFVSNALWAGGFPKQPGVWSDQGHYSYDAPGTADAWLVPRLLNYLQGHFSVQYTNITSDLRSNAVPGAEAGDLIFYDWEKTRGEGITHVAIIVGFASGDYPEVSEMSQYEFGTIDTIANKIVHVTSPYQKRGWTWSAIHHEWLQRRFPNMKAYLLHFNGGYEAPTF